MEARTPASRERDGSEDDGYPPAARHQQMEPDRAPAVRLHHHELARQASGEPPGDRATYRCHHHRDRPQSLLRDRWKPLSEGSGGIRPRAPGDQPLTWQIPRRVELHHRTQSAATVTHLLRRRPLVRRIAERDAQKNSWHRLDGSGALWNDEVIQAALRL